MEPHTTPSPTDLTPFLNLRVTTNRQFVTTSDFPNFCLSVLDEVQVNELRREVVSQDDEARRGAAEEAGFVFV